MSQGNSVHQPTAAGAASQAFADRLAIVLMAKQDEIGERWRAQAPSVAPRVETGHGSADVPGQANTVLAALACALRRAPRCQEGVMHAGWELGAATYTAGSSLHYMTKELDLLESMVLYRCERAVVDDLPSRDEPPASAADAFSVARRLHRSFAVLRLAASNGYAHAYVDALRLRYRTLRHDLRNPLGTIKSAVSLMEDESIPAEMRNSPRFRAMVTRNATSLEGLIKMQLSDAKAEGPAFARQELALRDVVQVVRRDLREEAELVECEVVVDGELPVVQTDSATIEIALGSIVSAMLQGARPGSRIAISVPAMTATMVTLALDYEPMHAGVALDAGADLAFARDLVLRTGGRVRTEGTRVLVDVAIVEGESGEEAAVVRVERAVGGGAAAGGAVVGDVAASSGGAAASPSSPSTHPSPS